MITFKLFQTFMLLYISNLYKFNWSGTSGVRDQYCVHGAVFITKCQAVLLIIKQ